MTKRNYIIIAVLTILLYTTVILYNYGFGVPGEVFGYLFYVIIIVGIVAAVWLLLKRPKTEKKLDI